MDGRRTLRQYDETSAVVLRAVDFSETSKIVTLMTRDLGKIAAIAKGGRRIRSSFDLSLDVLSVCRICVIRKPTAELDLLTEARLEERFVGLQKNLSALYAGYFAAEIVDGLLQSHDPHAEVFDELVAALETLSAGGDRLGAVGRLTARLLVELGYAPRLDACCVCGAACPMGRHWVSYSAQTGGVLCEECRKTHFGLVQLTPSTLRSLDDLFADDHGEAARTPLPAADRGPVWRTLLTHLQILLGKTPKTAALLRW
jgi:DNA repair protein RecO (recombination protein O)